MVIEEAKGKFRPITITLESREEVDDFMIHIQSLNTMNIKDVEDEDRQRIYQLGVNIYRTLLSKVVSIN